MKSNEEVVIPEEEGASEKERTLLEIEPTKGEDGQSHREQMQLLISAFSNEQQDQYEIFRRSTFPKSSIRRIMQSMCSTNIPQNAVIAMAGITKVYVGEVVEAACQVSTESHSRALMFYTVNMSVHSRNFVPPPPPPPPPPPNFFRLAFAPPWEFF